MQLCIAFIFCSEGTTRALPQIVKITRVKVFLNPILTQEESTTEQAVTTPHYQKFYLQSAAASTHGAFSSINMINRHAIIYKIKKDMALKPREGRRQAGMETPTTGPQKNPRTFALPKADKNLPVVGANSLFISRNWGNQ